MDLQCLPIFCCDACDGCTAARSRAVEYTAACLNAPDRGIFTIRCTFSVMSCNLRGDALKSALLTSFVQLEFFADDELIRVVPNFSLPTFSQSTISCIGVSLQPTEHQTFILTAVFGCAYRLSANHQQHCLAGKLWAIQAKCASCSAILAGNSAL